MVPFEPLVSLESLPKGISGFLLRIFWVKIHRYLLFPILFIHFSCLSSGLLDGFCLYCASFCSTELCFSMFSPFAATFRIKQNLKPDSVWFLLTIAFYCFGGVFSSCRRNRAFHVRSFTARRSSKKGRFTRYRCGIFISWFHRLNAPMVINTDWLPRRTSRVCWGNFVAFRHFFLWCSRNSPVSALPQMGHWKIILPKMWAASWVELLLEHYAEIVIQKGMKFWFFLFHYGNVLYRLSHLSATSKKQMKPKFYCWVIEMWETCSDFLT